MNARVHTDLEALLSKSPVGDVRITETSSVGGGCINETARIKTTKGVFFAKWNDAKQYPHMLASEAKGLELLRSSNEIKVPQVIASGAIGNTQYLILENIDSARTQNNFWHDFGRQLAKLHKHSADKFGLDHDNYIGSLPQPNSGRDTWSDFFIQQRLEPQLKLAKDAGRVGKGMSSGFEKLFAKLDQLFPPEKPSLLHGDLWSGNYLVGSKGEPCIIDPAVYYGHREMDLGMTRLFGGFAPEFYRAYHEEFPLSPGWEQRTDLCNLYPLMVHVNLFGGGYASQVEAILKRF